jgi:hypothetical protein
MVRIQERLGCVVQGPVKRNAVLVCPLMDAQPPNHVYCYTENYIVDDQEERPMAEEGKSGVQN